MTYCHAYGGPGVGVCTLSVNHGGYYHIDTVHNRSWPMVTESTLLASLHATTARDTVSLPHP